MAKSHYSDKKRKKELVRKERKEQKRQQKLDRAKKRSEQDSVHFQEEMENIETQNSGNAFVLFKCLEIFDLDAHNWGTVQFRQKQ